MIRSKKWVFAMIPSLIFMAIFECTARIIGTEECKALQPDAGEWETMQGDSKLLWRLVPNTVFKTGDDVTRINSIGLRETLLPSTKKNQREKRIIVTGDSSIYGWGLKDNETYAVFLERELRSRFSVPIEVINLGVPGYSTEQTIRLLDMVGWEYEPDLIIISNIFSDCNIDAFQDKTAFALSDPKDGFFGKSIKKSRGFCALYMPWVNFQGSLNQERNRVLMPGLPTGPNAAVTLENLNSTLQLSRVPLPNYLANLGHIKDKAEAHNAQILLAPLAQEWDVGIWNVPMPEPDETHILPWEPYRDAQKEWALSMGVGLINFPDVFANTTGNKNELFLDHMHPSRNGALIMAKSVADHIHAHPETIGLSYESLRNKGHKP